MNNSIQIQKRELASNCIEFSDERKRQVRVVIDGGKVYYCGVDIAACMGYNAPSKAIKRADIKTTTFMVPWISARKRGIVRTMCFEKKEMFKFIDRVKIDPELKKWLEREIVPQAERLLNKQRPAPTPPPTSTPTQNTSANPSDNHSEAIERIDKVIMEVVLLKHALLSYSQQPTTPGA